MTWAMLTSRKQSQKKKQAIADLQAEQDQLVVFDIYALVADEVADLRLKEFQGSTGVSDSVLLKLWNQSQSVVEGCPSRDMLRFVVADGVDPTAATDGDVTLTCDDMASDRGQPIVDQGPSDESPDEATAPDVDQPEQDSEPT